MIVRVECGGSPTSRYEDSCGCGALYYFPVETETWMLVDTSDTDGHGGPILWLNDDVLTDLRPSAVVRDVPESDRDRVVEEAIGEVFVEKVLGA